MPRTLRLVRSRNKQNNHQPRPAVSFHSSELTSEPFLLLRVRGVPVKVLTFLASSRGLASSSGRMALKGPKSEPNEEGEEVLSVVDPPSDGTGGKVRALCSPNQHQSPTLPGELPGRHRQVGAWHYKARSPIQARKERKTLLVWVSSSTLPLPGESGTGRGDT